jgi:hypothetical protein
MTKTSACVDGLAFGKTEENAIRTWKRLYTMEVIKFIHS